MDVPGKWIDRARQDRALDKLILVLKPGAPGMSGDLRTPGTPTVSGAQQSVAELGVRVNAFVSCSQAKNPEGCRSPPDYLLRTRSVQMV